MCISYKINNDVVTKNRNNEVVRIKLGNTALVVHKHAFKFGNMLLIITHAVYISTNKKVYNQLTINS